MPPSRTSCGFGGLHMNSTMGLIAASADSAGHFFNDPYVHFLRNALGVSNLPTTLSGEHRIRNIPASLGRATLGRLIFGGCISSTDLRLSQPCPPYVTPSSISSFGRRLNGAQIVGSASVKDFSTKRFCQSSARSCSRRGSRGRPAHVPQTPLHGSDVPVDGWKRFKGA